MYVYIFRYNYVNIQSHNYTCKHKLNPDVPSRSADKLQAEDQPNRQSNLRAWSLCDPGLRV